MPNEDGDLGDRRSGFVASVAPMARVAIREGEETMTSEQIRLEGMGSLRRSHGCGESESSMVGTEVVVAGWVHRRRDHGGVIFVDLRDRTGIVQVVFRPETSADSHGSAGALRSEWVVMVRGIVEARSEETINPRMQTGMVEINVHEVRILNSASPPPFSIEEDSEVDESVRLRHRIHDLRRPPLQRALRVRHMLAQAMRSSLSRLGFTEIETPMLARATPEGARDFLVPSRLQPGGFYALPQSPQIMKQLLMVAGFDRYFQIARCFRDEDQRADRQLEFTQVDLEMSFVGVEDVLEVLEIVTSEGCLEAAGVELARPFSRISYAEAMARYGCDRPDTRILLELVDMTEIFAGSEFKAFRDVVGQGGIVKCLPIHDAEEVSRSEIDRLDKFVRKELGARGLGWIRIDSEGEWRSPIAKFLTEDERGKIAERCGARPGSLLFFQADDPDRANAILSRLRIDLGEKLGRVDGREWDVLLVVDFPLFEKDENGQLGYVHQPFVAPVEEDIPLLESEPEKVRGTHYDVIVNGVELGSGSLRNHDSGIQRRILGLMGYSAQEMEKSFGFMLEALEVGAPPHGGFAFGFDRMAMVLAGAESLRDVIAFPKTQRGQDLLMQAPSEVDPEQLDELSIRLRPERSG
jgi:aspartyl-tRNA synthetase